MATFFVTARWLSMEAGRQYMNHSASGAVPTPLRVELLGMWHELTEHPYPHAAPWTLQADEAWIGMAFDDIAAILREKAVALLKERGDYAADFNG